MLEYEHQQWQTGVQRLAGVDEAGRGPLAGPVVAAAVIIPQDIAQSQLDGPLASLTDSKQLSHRAREEYFEILHDSQPIEIGVGISGVTEIDDINILRATHVAMSRAVSALPKLPEHVLVDGLPVKGLPCPSTAVVKGDSKSLLIAAASVVAKVTRDRIMLGIDLEYPGYDFKSHKGYGTKAHLDALRQFGPCPEHRRSFAPVKEALGLGQQTMDL